MRKWSADAHIQGACGHAWCTDCAKRRGRNRGNRRIRAASRRALRKELG